MDTVLFITDLHTGSHVVTLAGVYARAAAHNWRVIEIERDRTTRPLREFVATWRPVGCIMECGKLTEPVDTRRFNIPIVYIDPDPVTLRRPCHAVTNDAAALARRAAAELAALRPAAYAYVGWCSPTSWSIDRGTAFRREIAARHGACALYDTPWQDTFAVQKRLARWLAAQPRPLGVFAANDYAAEQVAGACTLAGLESPRDVAIVGVDNDELLCENSFPTLTSIQPDFKAAGCLAADLLADLIRDPQLPPRRLTFGPLGLYRRQSTRIVNSNDSRIIHAVERIRRDACSGLTAADVLAEIGLSRRLAEKRFRAATGRTILGEIQEVRFARVLQLLRETDLPIGQLAGLCGWESDSYLKRFFKKRTGLTLREGRARRIDAGNMIYCPA